MRFRITPPLYCSLIIVLLTGCRVGPDYMPPQVTIPDQFKEIKGWKQAQSRDNVLSGKWWEMFNDARLNPKKSVEGVENRSC